MSDQLSSNFQSFNKPAAASFPPCIGTMDPLLPNMDLSNCNNNQFTGLNPSSHLVDACSSFDFHSLMGFTNDGSLFLPHQTAEFPGIFLDNIPGAFNLNNQKPVSTPPPPLILPIDQQQSHETKKRKVITTTTTTEVSGSSSGFTYAPSPAASEVGIKRRQNSRKGKKVKANDQEEDKPGEVIHVRARRGQATDSHSLAERVRRGKINERLRCLQDIVPGCYKTMGMAVMLDEIINYVQSLQNQVEFLSMKLTAASTLHDMNAEAAALQTLQRAKAEELQEMERLMRESYGGPTCFPPIWPQ